MAKNPASTLVDAAAAVNPTVAVLKEGVDTLTGGFEKLAQQIREQVAQYEQYRISLTLATGANAKFVDTIRQEAYELNKYGVTFNNLVKVNEDIAKSYSQATFSSAQTRQEFEGQRQEVQKLISVNEKFGASTDVTIGLLNKLGNSVFNNVGQVGKFSDSLLKFSRETGQSFGNVLQQFSSYSDRFITAISSDKATQSFATLELLARRSGASVDKLVGSISKFDDIDEAFSTGGNFNRVLSYFGGSFDTLAAANASDEERAQMFIKSISSISDKFNQVTNPQSRRSMLKELEKSSGLPMEMITGLLNKSNKLSEDLTSIMRTPVEVKPSAKTYSDEEKKAMALEVTDSATVKKIKDEALKMGTVVSMVEKVVAANKVEYVKTIAESGKSLDKLGGKLLKEGKINEAATELNNAAINLKNSFMSTGNAGDTIRKIFSGDLGAAVSYAKDQSKKGQEGDAKAAGLHRKENQEMEARAAKDRAEESRLAREAAAQHAKDIAAQVGASVKTAFDNTNVTFKWIDKSGKENVEKQTFSTLIRNR